MLISPTSVKTSDSRRLLAQVEATAPGVTDWEGSDVPAVHDDLRALRDIVEGTARGTGEEFFRSLVRRLASAIDVPYAVVAEFADVNTRARTVAFWARDRIAENMEYDLAATPCDAVARGIRASSHGCIAELPERDSSGELGHRQLHGGAVPGRGGEGSRSSRRL